MKHASKLLGAAVVASTLALTAAPASAAVTVEDRISTSGTSDIFFNWIGGAFNVRVDGADNNGIQDPEIFLFRDNGSASGSLTGAFVANADDINFPSNLSARINQTLARGAYVLSVGTFDFTETEARSGVADFTPMQRRYVATFSDGTTISTGAVPEPATWAMMLVGFGGIGFAMRRRKSKVSTQIRFA